MASEKDLKDYVESLDPLYKEILMAFPRIEPHRKQGYGLAFQTLAVDFEDAKKDISVADIIEACRQLEEHGLMKIKNRIFAYPTPTGEKLIALLTGNQTPERNVPKLPPLPK